MSNTYVNWLPIIDRIEFIAAEITSNFQYSIHVAFYIDKFKNVADIYQYNYIPESQEMKLNGI